MAEQEKTKNYGLTIFADTQTDLTFKEFRKILAGIGTDEASYSDIQKIDAVLKQCSVSIAENLDAAKNYTEEQLAQFKKANDELIKATDDGKLIIGGESGKPIDFNDGTSISTLKDGVFTVNGVEVNFARFGDYMLKYNAINNHLQLSYKPKVELEGGE